MSLTLHVSLGAIISFSMFFLPSERERKQRNVLSMNHAMTLACAVEVGMCAHGRETFRVISDAVDYSCVETEPF